MPIILDGIGGTLWSTGTRKTITSIAAMIAAMFGAYSAIKANANDIEYVIPAHRGFVRVAAEEILAKHAKEDEERAKLLSEQTKKVQRVLYHVQIEQADGKREAVENDLFKAQLEMKKAEKVGDSDTAQFVQQQVIKLQETKSKLDRQIDTLSRNAD